MIRKFSIGNKITLLVLVVVLLSVVAVSFITYRFTTVSLRDRYQENLGAVNKFKADKISQELQGVATHLVSIGQQAEVRTALDLYTEAADSTADYATSLAGEKLAPVLDALQEVWGYGNLLVMDREGRILHATQPELFQLSIGTPFSDADGRTLDKAGSELFYSNVYPVGDAWFMHAALPLKNSSGQAVAIVLAQLNMAPIYTILADTTSLGNSGESLLVQQGAGTQLVFASPLRNQPELLPLMHSISLGQHTEIATQEAFKGKWGSDIDTDYRAQETLAIRGHIAETGWGLVTKIDTAEINSLSNSLLTNFMLAGGAILLICMMIAIIFSRILINPLLNLKASLQLLGRGVLPESISVRSNDEIGEMAVTIDGVVKSLKNTASFAHKIGEGHFDAEFQPLSEQDTLGTALISMRDSIQEAEARDKDRNWIVTGVAEIGEILRIHNNLEELGDAVIAYVTRKVGAIQGAFYVVNDDDQHNPFIELKASYAYNKKKYLKGRYRFAEGLVGQAAIEQDTLLRTEIPYNYLSITSGLLGEQRPDCLLIVPLITNEQVYGVLEFAGFGKFTPKHVKFVEEISLITARTVFNIKVNERTHRLLDESQKMSRELQMQQEVLRQNAEEMEATQEELKRTNHRLEEQIDEVNKTQKRMQLLLENASEVITIYEKDGTVRYISPSVERILGYSQDEMMGKRDIVYVHAENQESVEGMFRQLLDNPHEHVTVQFQFKAKDGNSIWLEATGNNLLNDPAIQGILVNTRDITERRRAEQEQRMRSQMQALSENSPDLITRLNNKNEFFYINPIIQAYTGNHPEELVNKSLTEVGFHDKIVNQLVEILRDVRLSNSKVSTEMEFPTQQLGERVMQVNAIPEFNDYQELESVLVVSHDITDRKLIEMEIQAKNKKINDSINYAQRIQGAILPDNQLIRRLLPDSFILYKPRDVVSGDFPWFMQVGDDIFLAAVDCTGHGVPGALISLIGYFLLNDIVRSRKITDPGEILDALDAGVTQTLRQDEEDSKTKDGMDISLCKINLKKRTLEYAGAHRPLYYLQGGELQEIKGDRFPIGGGKFKNQTNFTNTKLSLAAGDAVYFCSDGFPDQFGGEDNRKFGPKRLRDMINEQKDNSMRVQMMVFDERWEQWKGEHKQTDDMLLIGIRF
ncbi:PAS domain S-box protein [Cesiribacter andamanensis]|uniref:Sensory histidine kinase AtoS n=1 Tax=Cesiribacter andamanensis AMV16 TaxID=1279009 RepID=M7N8R7_9BACT|nr:PAS domain S-box protein [Cesiribacter andamanensis]EMR03606.1 sensory histidine kinase AtoS [Cesiribacter andamanensis AMV16]